MLSMGTKGEEPLPIGELTEYHGEGRHPHYSSFLNHVGQDFGVNGNLVYSQLGTQSDPGLLPQKPFLSH